MKHIFSILKLFNITFLVLLSGSINTLLSQIDSQFEISKDYSTFGQFEYSGLNRKEAMAATGMFYGGLSEDELTQLCPDDLKSDFKKYSEESVGNGKYLNYQSYGKALKNAWEYNNYKKSMLDKMRSEGTPANYSLDISNKSIIGDSQIRINMTIKHWTKNNSLQNDELSVTILINIDDNQVIFKPEFGNYSYDKKAFENSLTISKSFDELFNKKGEPKYLFEEDFKMINNALNKVYDCYKTSFESFMLDKHKLDDKIRSEIIELRSIERAREVQDSIERVRQAQILEEQRLSDSLNSLFTGVVIGEFFYDGDHTIEILITSRGNAPVYNPLNDKETFYLQSGINDEYSILIKNGLSSNGENIIGTYVKGRWAMGLVTVEEFQDDGSIIESTKSVPRIIEIEPVVDENTNKFTKFSGNWSGKFTETKYRTNKIHGEWNVIVSNNGIVLGEATSNYVVIKGGKEYNRTSTDQISGVLSADGEINMKTADGAIFTGRINGSSVSGNWVNGSNLGGGFSGVKEAP